MFGKLVQIVALVHGSLALQPQAAKPQPAPPPAAEKQVEEKKPTVAPGPTAAEVLAGVQKYYQATDKLQATFRQKYTNTVFGKTSTSDGQLFIQKPGKMHWYYTKPDKKSFVTDGKTLWIVEYANKQALVKSLQDEVLPVAVTFLTGKGDLAKDFIAAIDKKGKYGAKGDLVVMLKPRQPSAQYKYLWLVVDATDFHVKESVIQEASDNINHFTFSGIKLNDAATKVKDSQFVVSEAALKKQGIKIVKPDDEAKKAAKGDDK